MKFFLNNVYVISQMFVVEVEEIGENGVIYVLKFLICLLKEERPFVYFELFNLTTRDRNT